MGVVSGMQSRVISGIVYAHIHHISWSISNAFKNSNMRPLGQSNYIIIIISFSSTPFYIFMWAGGNSLFNIMAFWGVNRPNT